MHGRMRRDVPAALLVGTAMLLAGCTGGPATHSRSPTPRTSATCADAVARVVDAARTVVSGYAEATTGASPSPLPSPTGAAVAPTDALSSAVSTARSIRRQAGCAHFDDDLATGLAGIPHEGTVRDAVWRRLSATLLGTVGDKAATTTLAAGQDLRDAVARAASGSTIVLPKGITNLDDTLVLLDGIAVRGAGRDASVLRSDAADAAVLIAAAGTVRFSDLSVRLVGARPASGIVAGPQASLALNRVRVSGAKAGSGGAGGAGVYVSGSDTGRVRTDTTLEVTESVLSGNGWAGLAVTGDGRVSIESATVADNTRAGIVFLDHASGSVAHSTMRGNGLGVAITGHASPALESNIVSGGSVGVQADSSAAPTIKGLRVTGTRKAALIMSGSARGWVGGVSCPGTPFGIVVAGSAAPTLESNTCPLQAGAR
ncbi:hypothetical protein LK09_04615 [Microbacterium mangrovi]|uniref:Right handed beta helix domain-containing protein n=1 Tax=Microbacterium mangrovi TaxID=1348253 RepID=A0A0B2A9C6_9MICO|nr:right-handed parallel beta-helix repeat-containing protein [Microbacterium mangrovi]KHK98313.1 hypothetical protein LK09_04615 [Microbacterium mangrovi]